MIFYFTGTGNSLQIARDLSERQDEKLISISVLMDQKPDHLDFTLEKNEVIGFVFPIYSWNPPKMVLEFIRKLRFANYGGNYVFSAVTCGDNIGNTMKTLESELNRIGLSLHSGFSVRMPNNYMIGFDVDPKEVENRKLLEAEAALKELNKIITNREKGVFRIEKGPVPFILSSIINPLFNGFAIRPQKFNVTEQCTGCGICERVCNCKNVRLEGVGPKKDQRPVWGRECTQCLACLNYCPVKAVQFGKWTVKKGRYTNPNVSIKEISYWN